METIAKSVWLHIIQLFDRYILLINRIITKMDRSSSKEDIDSISVHSMHRQPETVSMSDLRQRENISLAEHIRSHPSIKVLTH